MVIKKLIDYKGRELNLEDIYKIDFTQPDEGFAGKFVIKAILKESNVTIYQSVGTADTYEYNKLEISYVLRSLEKYIKTEYDENSTLDLRKTIDFCRKKLFESYVKQIDELKEKIKDLEDKLEEVSEKIVIDAEQKVETIEE